MLKNKLEKYVVELHCNTLHRYGLRFKVYRRKMPHGKSKGMRALDGKHTGSKLKQIVLNITKQKQNCNETREDK